MAARRTLLSGGLAARTAQELTVPVEALREGRRVLRKLEIFVVRGEDETLAAYENHCPHAGGPLNQFPDRFFSRDQRRRLADNLSQGWITLPEVPQPCAIAKVRGQ